MFNTNQALGFLISAVNQGHELSLGRKLKDLGITAVQGAIMDQIYQHEGINQKTLAAYCRKDSSSLTKILDILAKKELIVRSLDTNDRRAFKLYLTAKGTQIVNESRPIAEFQNNLLLSGILDEDVETTKKVLLKILDNLENEYNKE